MFISSFVIAMFIRKTLSIKSKYTNNSELYYIKYVDDFLIKKDDCYKNTFITSKISNNNTYVCFYNCTFKLFDSTTTDYTTENGIILYLYNSKSALDCCVFSNNTIFSYSSFIYLSSTNISFSNNYFIDNYIIYKNSARGSFIYLTKSNCTFDNNSFSNNYFNDENFSTHFDIEGNMIFLKESSGYFNNCLFSNNIINYNYGYHDIYGVFLYLIYSNGTIDNCSFLNNFLYFSLDSGFYLYGGFIYLSSSIFNFNICSFINNSMYSIEKDNYHCHNTLMGISIHLFNSFCNFIECNFLNNTIYIKAEHVAMVNGLIFLEQSDCHFFQSKFSNINIKLNVSIDIYFFGGLIHSKTSNCTINTCEFVNNKVDIYTNELIEIYGLMIHIDECNFIMKTCTFFNNSDSLCQINSHPIRFHGNLLYMINSNSEISHCIFKNENFGCLFMLNSNCSFYEDQFCINYLTLENYTIVEEVYGGTVYMRNSDCKFVLCQFYSLDNLIDLNIFKGLVIYMYVSKGLFDNCRFNVTNKMTKSAYGIIFFRDFNVSFIPSIEIRNCVFDIDLDSTIEGNSILYFEEARNLPNTKYLINNSFIIKKICNIVVFGGIFTNCKFMLNFENNCLYPYENRYFKDGIQIYDENGINTVSFDDVFNQPCLIPTPFFTSSKMFTDSSQFTESLQFSNSKIFSNSQIFSNSKIFSNSQIFSNSKIFSNSQKFPISKKFSNSNKFTKSNDFTKTFTFSDSNVFTKSEMTKSINSKSSDDQYKKYVSYSITYCVIRSVSFSYSYDFLISDYSYYPYIIEFLSPSYIQTYYFIIEKRKKITQENLIGIVCGPVAIFFLLISIIIFIHQKKNEQRIFLEEELSSSTSSSNVIETKTTVNHIFNNINADNDKNNFDINDNNINDNNINDNNINFDNWL